MNFNIIILLITLAFANTTNVYFEGCDNPSITADDKCSIQEMHVEPCPTSTTAGLCDVEKLSKVFFTIEYTPNFDGKISYSFYHVTHTGDFALTFPADICGRSPHYLICEDLRTITVNSTIKWTIPDILPNGQSRFKIKLWNNRQNECCFAFNLNVINQTRPCNN